MLSDTEILTMVEAEADDAIGYRDDLGAKRATLLEYYNTQPYGDEVDGRSRFVSSDVADVVEWMLPSLLRVFTQGRHIAKFEADLPDTDKEAEQKTELSNYVFMRQNDGVLVLHNMFKDALLQYTGVVKVAWVDEEEVTHEKYKGLSQDEFDKMKLDKENSFESVTKSPVVDGDVFDLTVARTSMTGRVDYQNIPPEEFVVARNARDFRKPRFIGHTPPKTRSELIAMGFDKEQVDLLPADNKPDDRPEAYVRRKDIASGENNPTTSAANDVITLGEYYAYLDVDEDGTSELWQVFTAGHEILQKTRFDRHPFAVVVPVPMPHRAIGSCPAEQTADIQLVKSVLVRQGLDNIYNTNWNRLAYNERVDLDDLFTPRPGGGVAIEGTGDIGNSLMPITTIPQVDGILQAVEYMDSSREIRTGMTRYSQGLDGDALNKTATGFKGIMDASQQRMELIARLFAETGVREIFRLTAMLLTKFQDKSMQVRVTGAPMEIDPTAWRHNLDCRINVGLGSGDRNEKITNLSYILQEQKAAIGLGTVLSDQTKMFNTYDQIITELGLKDPNLYFNDPEQDDETLQAQVEQLTQAVTVLQQQANPLAEAEIVKAQASIAQTDTKITNDMRQFIADLMEKQRQFDIETALKATELELVHNQDVPGSEV